MTSKTQDKADEKYLNQIFPKGKIEFNAPQTKPDTAFVYSIQGLTEVFMVTSANRDKTGETLRGERGAEEGE